MSTESTDHTTAPFTTHGARELAVAALLPHHDRGDGSGCECGRVPLGADHRDHLVNVLDAAGLVLVRVAHIDHDLPREDTQ